jgi:hypothetical protein
MTPQHFALLAVIVAVAVWRGWIPIKWTRRPAAPAKTLAPLPQSAPGAIELAALAACAARREAEAELDQERAVALVQAAKAAYKAPFVTPAGATPS